MLISIEGLSGPHQGKVFEFDKKTPIILFGRSPSAQIHFEDNQENRSISRHHVELALQTDRYHLRLQDDNPVYLDGKEGFEDEEIDLGAHTLSLGSKDGPTYRVITRSQDAHLADTAPIYKKQSSARDSAKSGFKKVAAAIAVVTVISTIGYQLLFTKADQLEGELAVFTEQVENKVTSADFAEILRGKRESVYLVAMRKDGRLTGVGTAWVAASGLLATNAHVVDGVQEALDSEGFDDAVVVSTQPPYTQHRIEGMRSHPDYLRFYEHQSTVPRVMDNNQQLSLVPGYDVGLLKVDNPDKLAPPLKFANIDSLLSLDSGIPIAFIGFPLEDTMGGGTNYNQPTPQLQIGAVTSMSDYFLTGDTPSRNHLIQHNLPAHGGASGSPLFNDKGEVVGLFNAGTVVFVDNHRIATGVGVNFGQRVDILSELLEDTFEDISVQRTEFWGNRLASYRTPFDLMETEFKQKYGKGKETIMYSDSNTLKYNESVRANAWRYELPASNQERSIFVFAQSESGEDIDLAVITKQGNIRGQDKENTSYPNALLEHGRNFDSSKSHYVFVIGQEENVDFKVKIYSVPN